MPWGDFLETLNVQECSLRHVAKKSLNKVKKEGQKGRLRKQFVGHEGDVKAGCKWHQVS